MPRHDRPSRRLTGVLLLLVLALAAPAAAASGDRFEPSLRHWAFGWDPGETGRGLTLRYRPSPAWDLSLAAGPDDYRRDSDTNEWSTHGSALDTSTTGNASSEEEGWVRLCAGRKFWEQDRVSVSGICGVTYRWTVRAETYRDSRDSEAALIDYFNTRRGYDIEGWGLTLGIRPSVRINQRLQVEFEAGLSYSYSTTMHTNDEWYDIDLYRRHLEEKEIVRNFRSYGWLELSSLKLIFWF